jgi:hypothetical protein
MKVRPYKFPFEESMAKVFEVEQPTLKSLVDQIRHMVPEGTPDKECLRVVHLGLDERNGWDTYELQVFGLRPFGRWGALVYLDGPLKEEEHESQTTTSSL